jgi:TetR/AcrR family acrAB operon transcriptional repressor
VVTAHILEILSYGQLTLGDFKPPDKFPPYEIVMEGLADMMDRALTPEDGGNSAAGKAVLRQIATAVRAQLEQLHQAKNKQLTDLKETDNDH